MRNVRWRALSIALLAAIVAMVLLPIASIRLHGQVVISEGDEWHYFEGIDEPPLDWKAPSFDPVTAGWKSGPTGIGFGDDDDQTVLDEMRDRYVSVFLRIEFEAPAIDGDNFWILRVRYDDGFVAYVDGQEIARRGLRGRPPAFDELADDHEITDAAGFDEAILLTDSAALFTEGRHVLAVEIHNDTVSSSDLSFSCQLSAAPFAITNIEPGLGPIHGDIVISFRGLGFVLEDIPSVYFGSTPADVVLVVHDRLMRAFLPVVTRPGPVDVLVEDTRGLEFIQGGFFFFRPSQMGLAFNGGHHASAESYGVLGDQGTFEIWFRSSDLFDVERPVLAVEGNPGMHALLLETRSDRVHIHHRSAIRDVTLTVPASLDQEEWHHLAMSFSSEGREIHIDGGHAGGDDVVMTMPANARLRLGASFGDESPFVGRIHSARIWSVARAANDIHLYRFARFDAQPGLESAWHLDEATGALAKNAGSSGSTLILGDVVDEEETDPDWSPLEDFPFLAVTSLEPSSGPLTGGNTVSILGGGFSSAPATEVMFGEVPASAVFVENNWRAKVIVPPGVAAAPVDITVRVGEQTVTSIDAYIYERVRFVRGDTDFDGRITITDAVKILQGLFLGGELNCQEAADLNDDGGLNITDAVFLLEFMFQRGLAPPPPFPDPGYDEDDDGLGCGGI